MKKYLLASISILFILLFLVTGCSTSTPTNTADIQTANTAVADTPTEAAATETPEATVTVVTETPEATATAVPEVPTATEAAPLPCTIFFETDRDGNIEVYRMESDGSAVQNLTNSSSDDYEPAVSPDGSRVAFVSNRSEDGNNGVYIYIMNSDGSNVRKLDQAAGGRHPDWSPAGDQIVYDNNEEVFILKVDGGEAPVQISDSPDQDRQPVWSPDGEQIAWLSGPDGNKNIVVLNLKSQELKQITDDGKVEDLEWTVGGQIFTHWDNQKFGCFNCVMDADGSNIKDAGGKGTIQEYLPYFTNEGDRVECAGVSLNGRDDEIYLVGEIYPDMFLNLSNDPGNDRNPDWAARCGPVTNPSGEIAPTESASQENGGSSMVIGYEDTDKNMSSEDEDMLLQACKELNVQCVKGSGIPELIEKDVDAIISASSRWRVQGAYPDIHEAVEKGILEINVNGETEEQGAYNLSNDSNATMTTLTWMFKEMGDSGDFVYFNFGPSGTHQSYIDAVLKGYPDIKATSVPATYDGISLTEQIIADLVAENPNLGAIWSNEFLPNLFWGLNSAISQGKKVPLIVCDSNREMLQAWKGYIEAQPSFKCIASLKPGGSYYESVYVAYYILSGYQIDPSTLGGLAGNTFTYDYPFITNANLDEWLEKIDAMGVGEKEPISMPAMTPDEILERWFIEQ